MNDPNDSDSSSSGPDRINQKEAYQNNLQAFTLFILKHEKNLTDMYNSAVVSKIKKFNTDVSKQLRSANLTSLTEIDQPEKIL